MNLALFILLSCGLALAQDALNDDTEKIATLPYIPSCACDLQREVGVMQEKMRALESRLQDSEKQIEALKSNDKSDVVFSATADGSGSIGPFNTDKTLIYGTVMVNTGNAYNQHTGVFATPVSGSYYFTFFYHAGGSHPTSLVLYKNDEAVAQTYDHRSEHDGADNGGNAVILRLQKGDQVFVRLGANTHIWANHHITTFSGFLLSEA